MESTVGGSLQRAGRTFSTRISLMVALVTLSMILSALPLGRLHQTSVGVSAWPSPRYECCCKTCYGGCFICRNRDFSCNCQSCSCYSDSVDDVPLFKNPYIESLLKYYSGSRRSRR